MTLPLCSPFFQSWARERLQKVALPVATVARSASAFAQANMRTTPLTASWATTGTRPLSSNRVAASSASMFAVMTRGSVLDPRAPGGAARTPSRGLPAAALPARRRDHLAHGHAAHAEILARLAD